MQQVFVSIRRGVLFHLLSHTSSLKVGVPSYFAKAWNTRWKSACIILLSFFFLQISHNVWLSASHPGKKLRNVTKYSDGG
jgi:hypothetical protein